MAAACFVATLFACCELLARARGFVPVPRDDAAQWSTWRARANTAGARALVLVGSSRFQTGLDAEALERNLSGHEVAQLAINGSSPIPVLHDLADDESFRGSVLCELLPHTYFTDVAEPAQRAAEWVHNHHHKTWIADAENAVRHGLQAHLAMFLPELSFEQLATALVRRRAPVPAYSQPAARRAMLADYSRADVAALRRQNASAFRTVGRPLTAAERSARYDQLRRAVNRITARGGRVVFVRMPSSRTTLEAERYRFAAYYEDPSGGPGEFATVGAPLVNAERERPLNSFDCPDDSHLDRRDRVRFSTELARVLTERDLL